MSAARNRDEQGPSEHASYVRRMAKKAPRSEDDEAAAAWGAWLERLCRLDEEIGALAVDWPLEHAAHPDLSAAVDLARDGLTFMLPLRDPKTRARMRRMRNAQLGVKGTGDHRGMQMATAASVVLEIVLEVVQTPEPLLEARIELVAQHLTAMLSLHLPGEFPARSEAIECLRRARAKKGLLDWTTRYTPKRRSRGMTLAAITAHVLHEAGAFGLERDASEDQIAETTKALGVFISRYGLPRRFGPRAELHAKTTVTVA
jgi:hypothetical protein